MDVQKKDLDNMQKQLIIMVDAQDMEKYLERAAKRLGADMNIKGFREGKIPRKVVESSIGPEKVWQEAVGEAVQDFYWQAVEDAGIEPMGMPKIEISKFVPGSDVEFKATIPVMPELDLPDYKAIAQKTIKKEKKDVEVEDKEIEESLKWLQNSRTKVDEETKEEDKPELDDEFAKSLGEFEDLDALKKSLREGIHKEKIEQEKERLRLVVLESIRKKIDLKIPDFMIDQELDKMEEEFAQQVSQMGLSMEKYLEQAKKDIKEVRDGWKEKAEERVVSAIILRAIADKEGIEADEAEVQEEANRHLAHFKDSEEAQKHVDSERLKAHISGIIRNEKVFKFLEENNSAEASPKDSE